MGSCLWDTYKKAVKMIPLFGAEWVKWERHYLRSAYQEAHLIQGEQGVHFRILVIIRFHSWQTTSQCTRSSFEGLGACGVKSPVITERAES